MGFFHLVFSHRLELSLKDSLKHFINLSKKLVLVYFNLYKKLSKKLYELKLLASVMEEMLSLRITQSALKKHWAPDGLTMK